MSASQQQQHTEPSQGASVSRVYPNVNAAQPREYWDYENLQIQWG